MPLKLNSQPLDLPVREGIVPYVGNVFLQLTLHRVYLTVSLQKREYISASVDEYTIKAMYAYLNGIVQQFIDAPERVYIEHLLKKLVCHIIHKIINSVSM